jgi:hypothetical protein
MSEQERYENGNLPSELVLPGYAAELAIGGYENDAECATMEVHKS